MTVDQSLAAASPWRAEFRGTIGLAVPVVITQLGQIAIQTTETVMLGWLGKDALAAGALAVAFFISLFLAGLGVLIAVAPLVAQAHGAGDRGSIPSYVRQGLWLTVALVLPSLALMWFGEELLLLVGQDPVVAATAQRYLDGAMWGLAPHLWFVVLRCFVTSIDRPQPALVVMLAAVALNVPLSYGLIFGQFGLPALGVFGAGLASAIVGAFMCVALAVIVLLDPGLRLYRIFAGLTALELRRFGEILRVGLPIGGLLVLEMSMFTTGVVLIGLLGSISLAAHQIAMQCAAITYMVPLGVSQAATVRVGQAVGAGDPAGARRAGIAAFILGLGFMTATALILWLFARQITGVFLDLADPANAEVAALCVALLSVAALFQIFDGGQAIGAGALRGLKDTRVPLYLAVIGYWAVGIVSAILLAFWAEQGAVGVWLGLAFGLAVTALCLIERFRRLTARS